jgi:hypothetical protein
LRFLRRQRLPSVSCVRTAPPATAATAPAKRPRNAERRVTRLPSSRVGLSNAIAATVVLPLLSHIGPVRPGLISFQQVMPSSTARRQTGAVNSRTGGRHCGDAGMETSPPRQEGGTLPSGAARAAAPSCPMRPPSEVRGGTGGLCAATQWAIRGKDGNRRRSR